MSCRINLLNKKSGVTYVYESISFRDKKKKLPCNKRVCIGKLDPVSGEFIASKRLTPEQAAVRDPAVTASTEIVGPSIILDAITERLGLEKLLKSFFPNNYRQIKTMAYYLSSRGGPLSHCGAWCKSHAHYIGESLASQRISEVLNSIGIDGKQKFLSRWMDKVIEEDYLRYDITSISSYSELNEYIKYGHNRDKEKLPQMNLAILFGQKGRLPVYFQRTPGNITDVTTLHNLLKTFKIMEKKTIHYIMDKGFYSRKNIDELLGSRDKFLLSVPLGNKWLQHSIDEIYTVIHGPEGYQKIDDEILYVHSRLHPWGKENCRCYLHLYYNASARAKAVDQFNEELMGYKRELESGQLDNDHQDAYDTFFVITKTPKRGLKVSYNTQAVSQYINRYAGFQALLTNSIKDPIESLQIYRDKDIVEKSFDDLKNQLEYEALENA